jgi:hypothetical protein
MSELQVVARYDLVLEQIASRLDSRVVELYDVPE